jgi:hypothetical protein
VRTTGLINFVLITGASACLMGVVSRQPAPNTGDEYVPSRFVLPPDTPETDDEPLPYKFSDPSAKPLQQQPKSKLYMEDPANLTTKVE